MKVLEVEGLVLRRDGESCRSKSVLRLELELAFQRRYELLHRNFDFSLLLPRVFDAPFLSPTKTKSTTIVSMRVTLLNEIAHSAISIEYSTDFSGPTDFLVLSFLSLLAFLFCDCCETVTFLFLFFIRLE